MKDEEIHRRNNTFKLIRTVRTPVQVENRPTEYRLERVTVESGLTWEQAEAKKKLDRTLTAVQETKGEK